jgi:DNA-binding response OmpR family regulator
MRRLLLVDDDDDFREIISFALTFSGYDVVGVEGGAEALAWLASHPSPDLILLDLMMPGMSGAELKARLDGAALRSSVPVLVLSGDTRLAEHARAMGAAGWLGKPVELQDLVARIEALLASGEEDAAQTTA